MSTTTAETPSTPISRRIEDKLHRLRRRIALWFAVDGLGRLLAWIVALIGVDLAIDWWFAMDRPQRGVVLALIVAALAVVVYRRLFRPLARPLSDDALCLLVEGRYQQLGGSLISAMQFARTDEWQQQGASPALVAATIQQGTQTAGDLDFNRVLQQRRFAGNLALVVAMSAALAAIAFAVKRTETMSIWFDRNVLLAERSWPQDFYLSIDAARENVLRVPRGEDWPLGVSVTLRDPATEPSTTGASRAEKDAKHARSKAPDEMAYALRGPGQFRTENMERESGGLHFAGKLPAVTDPLEIRATSRGIFTPWTKVIPVDRPAVASLELTTTAPKYAGGKTQPLPPGHGPYSVLSGSTVRLHGVATKPLTAATLVRGATRQPLAVSAQREFDFELPFQTANAGAYTVELTDDEQMLQPGGSAPGPLVSRNAAQFTLRVLVDREPQIKVRLAGISGMVATRARLPLSAHIEDETAIVEAGIRYLWHGPADSKQEGTNLVRPAGLKEKLGQPSLDFAHVLDLAGLKIPVGSDLSLVVEASDNDDVAAKKSPGKSTPLLLRVVSDDELRTDLLRREKEQRQELERLVKIQIGILADTRELMLRGDDKNAAEKGPATTARVAREQKLLGTALTTIALRISELLVEAENNRLDEGSGALQQRLRDRVQMPLTDIATQLVPEAVGRLDEGRRVWTQAPERTKALTAAVALQVQIEAQLNTILKNMIKVEDFQVVLSLLLEIQQAQTDVLTKAEKERQEQIRKFLEEGGTKPPASKPPEKENEKPAPPPIIPAPAENKTPALSD